MATTTPPPAPRRRLRGGRGTVAVEAALVFPVLMLAVFGVIEWGLAFKNVATTKAAAQDGVRAASTNPKNANFVQAVVDVTERNLGALTQATPQRMRLYRADPLTGNPVDASGAVGTFEGLCPGDRCIEWTTWNGSRFTNPTGSWPIDAQNACPPTPDTVGVQIEVRHNFATGFFGLNMTLTERSIMRLEPLPRRLCAAEDTGDDD